MEGETEELISPGSSENQDSDAGAALDAAPEPAADSSSADDGDSRRDLLSVVRDAVKSGDTASPAKESGNPPAPGEATAKPDSREPDDEGFSDVPFHNHPRFRQLVQQRNQYRQAAEAYGKFTGYLDANGVTPQEAADILKIQALAKTNPSEAWTLLKPFAQQVMQAAGVILPQDLQQQVRAGKLGQAAAMEISRLRAQNASTQKAQEFQRERAMREQSQQAQQAVMTAVATAERELQGRDVDFAAKVDDLKKEIYWLQREHVTNKRGPVTPEIARQMVLDAYKTVSGRMAQVSPPQRGRDQQGRFQPANVASGRVAGGQTTAAPKSILDVVRGARSAG